MERKNKQIKKGVTSRLIDIFLKRFKRVSHGFLAIAAHGTPLSRSKTNFECIGLVILTANY
jgi:hypothetical protein